MLTRFLAALVLSLLLAPAASAGPIGFWHLHDPAGAVPASGGADEPGLLTASRTRSVESSDGLTMRRDETRIGVGGGIGEVRLRWESYEVVSASSGRDHRSGTSMFVVELCHIGGCERVASYRAEDLDSTTSDGSAEREGHEHRLDVGAFGDAELDVYRFELDNADDMSTEHNRQARADAVAPFGMASVTAGAWTRVLEHQGQMRYDEDVAYAIVTAPGFRLDVWRIDDRIGGRDVVYVSLSTPTGDHVEHELPAP